MTEKVDPFGEEPVRFIDALKGIAILLIPNPYWCIIWPLIFKVVWNYQLDRLNLEDS